MGVRPGSARDELAGSTRLTPPVPIESTRLARTMALEQIFFPPNSITDPRDFRCVIPKATNVSLCHAKPVALLLRLLVVNGRYRRAHISYISTSMLEACFMIQERSNVIARPRSIAFIE